MTEDDATLTFNTIGRHLSQMVDTRIATVKSPWLANVNVGDSVIKGQIIGIMGCTGSCTGTHLDFRVQKNGDYLNPFNIYK